MEFTGRYLVLDARGTDNALPRMLRDQAGLRVAAASDFPRGTVDAAELAGSDGVYFENLGIAVTSSNPDQADALTRSSGLIVERERVIHPFNMPPRDNAPMDAPAALLDDGGVGLQNLDRLVCSLTATGMVAVAAIDESANTWGLVTTGVLHSVRTGRGVRVAVLDTGFDLSHPDFAGRTVVSKSFIDGEDAQDEHSHGTHCIGTAAGPSQPRTLPRYGVATEAEIYVGKVLPNSGRGRDGSILAGMNWAIQQRCRVLSMSLGSRTTPESRYSQVFESAAQKALKANSLIIAAAGNESARGMGRINPVGHPANCPSIMAVGAVDWDMKIAPFSTRGMNDAGGRIDIVGPGVDVYSSVPQGGHQRKSGTSMACPHVAGIAALYCEANPTASAREIWEMLIRDAKKLELEVSDMGAGLVQAPR